MKITLTDIIKKFQPEPITLEIDGKSYVIADLTIATADKLSNLATMSDDDALRFVEGLFIGELPSPVVKLRESITAGDNAPFIERQTLQSQVSLIVGAIAVAVQHNGGDLNAAVKLIHEQFEANDENA